MESSNRHSSFAEQFRYKKERRCLERKRSIKLTKNIPAPQSVKSWNPEVIMVYDPAPHRKRIAGKIYEKWMIDGGGHPHSVVKKLMASRRHPNTNNASSVRYVRATRSTDKEDGIRGRIY